MNALFLGGNSPRNQGWVHAVRDANADLFTTAIFHDYKHWETGDELVDIDSELPKIVAEITGHGPYIIFAKSIGSVLTLKGMNAGELAPRACVFAGLPLKIIGEMSLPVRDWLAEVTVPVIFLHNTNDPIGSFEVAKEFILSTGNPNFTVIETPGDDHSYDDFVLIRSLLEEAIV